MSGWGSRYLGGLAVALSAALLGGCAGGGTTIRVEAPPEMNGGSVLYMAARSADQTVTTESYQDAADKLFGAPPSKQVLTFRPVFPGENVTVKLDETVKTDVMLYFFFTAPGRNWRLLLNKPLPAELRIKLGEHQIESYEK